MTTTGSPGARLRALLASPDPSPVVGVYDGLSARVAAASGFDTIWASGLGMSTSLGLRDSDEASWSELLACATRIVEAVDVPVLVDGDTGYGSFGTARRFAVGLERAGAAGVCLEDKVFPKVNSFVAGEHRLAPVPEFCGKLRALSDARRDPDFVLVARVEALVAGAGTEEALRRAEAYHEAGADAIFIHSRRPDVDEIADFAERWDGRLPLMVSPTTFYDTEPEVFAKLRIGAVVWANQPMRAALAAMRRVCRELRADGPGAVEPWIAPLKELFGLMDYDGLAEDRRRYDE